MSVATHSAMRHAHGRSWREHGTARAPRRPAPPDAVMAGCVLTLCLLSLVMVASASMSISEVRYHSAWRIIGHWAVYVPLGLLLMWQVSRIETSWWRALAVPLLALALALLALVLALGAEINGARRWFSLLGLTLQPVEFVKPVMVLYMAHYMAAFPERLKRFSTGLAPMLTVLGVALLLLLLQPDFGSAVLLAATCLCLWFVGGVPMRHLGMLLLAALPPGLVILLAEPYRVRRMLSFLDPWSDPLGSGYQLVQSMLAFGSGGLTGAGLGQGVQKLFYLPEPFTDFIGAVLAEEFGLAGTLLLIATFAVLVWRMMRVAMIANDAFSRLVATGAATMLGATFCINMGAAMGIMPTKGMPLPFVSYGGSALLGNGLLLGMVFAVQRRLPRNARRERRS